MEKKKLLRISLAGLAGAAAGLFFAWRTTKKAPEGTPPKGAPQLHLQNPGDQSEFPSAPEGERDLG